MNERPDNEIDPPIDWSAEENLSISERIEQTMAAIERARDFARSLGSDDQDALIRIEEIVYRYEGELRQLESVGVTERRDASNDTA